MIFDQILNIKYLLPATVNAVYMYAVEDNVFQYQTILLAKKKNKVNILDQKTGKGTFEEVLGSVNRKYPLCLSLDGKGILIKKSEVENGTEEKLKADLFPQGNSNDFYLQMSDAGCYKQLAMARKEYVNNYLEILKDKGIKVFDIAFGPFTLNNVYKHTDTDGGDWVLQNRTVCWDDDSIDRVTTTTDYTPFFVRFGEESVSSESIIPFSHAFTALLLPDLLNNVISEVVYSRTNQKYHKAFIAAGVFSLAFYLILLLANYFAFTSYSSSLQQTYAGYDSSIKLISDIEQYTGEIKQKEELVLKTGMSSGVQYSFLADRIVLSVPGNVTLTSLAINPVEKKQRMTGTGFRMNYIVISGNINNSTLLYKWVNKLNDIDFVNHVEILGITENDIKTSAFFELELEYKLPDRKE